MSWRKTIILGLLFLCAGAGYLLDRNLSKKHQLMKEREEALLNLDKKEINAISLRNQEGAFRLVKKENDWFLVQPRELKADKDQLESLLSNLTAARKYDPVETKDFSQYGLEKPRREITLECEKTGTKITLFIGLESTSSGRYFARINTENSVFAVASHIKNNLDKNLYHLRDKTVFDIKQEALSGLEIAQPGQTIVLQKSDGEKWRILEPVKEVADDRAVKNLLSDIATLRATSFEDDQTTTPGFYGLDQPWLSLTISAGREQTLFIGKEDTPAPRFFARKQNDPQVFTLAKRFVEALAKKPGALRSKELFKIAPENVREVKFIVGDTFFSVKKDDKETWQFPTRPDWLVDQSKMDTLLNELSLLQIQTFEQQPASNLETFGLKAPSARVILYPENREQKEILSFGDKAKNRDICFARISTRSAILGLNWTKVGAFYLTEQDLRDRRILHLDPENISRMEISEKQKTLVLERKQDHWFAKKNRDSKGEEVPHYMVFGVMATLTNLSFEHEITDIAGDKLIPSEDYFNIYDKNGGKIESLQLFRDKNSDALLIKTLHQKLYSIREVGFSKLKDDFHALFETPTK